MAKEWQLDRTPGDKKGLIADVRAGAKVVESYVAGDQSFNPVGQAAGMLRWYIPIVKADNPNTMAGLIHLEAAGFLTYTGGQQYRDIFANALGETASRLLGSASISGSVFIVDQFYVSAGYALSHDDRVPHRKFLSVSFSGAK